jgi:hypothetical protein
MHEIYVSTDVETDGPVAGKHSMLSIGSAAYSADKRLLSSFSANLETLPEFTADPKTTAWWATQPDAWSACRQNLEHPRVAMPRYLAWLKALPGKPVFVAYPAVFDFSFVYWYLTQYAGENPFGYSAIDIKTYAMAMLRKPYRACGKLAELSQSIRTNTVCPLTGFIAVPPSAVGRRAFSARPPCCAEASSAPTS